ncbi:hypothetical protein ACFLVC_01900 [Chloroflexota bacterium]
MKLNHTSGMWKAVLEDGKWRIRSSENNVIATVENGSKDEANARLIAASPMIFEALSGLVELIGEEDLPDNGELSGAAICDLARSTIATATGDEKWPFS